MTQEKERTNSMGEKNWPPGGVGPFITDTPKPKAEETLLSDTETETSGKIKACLNRHYPKMTHFEVKNKTTGCGGRALVQIDSDVAYQLKGLLEKPGMDLEVALLGFPYMTEEAVNV